MLSTKEQVGLDSSFPKENKVVLFFFLSSKIAQTGKICFNFWDEYSRLTIVLIILGEKNKKQKTKHVELCCSFKRKSTKEIVESANCLFAGVVRKSP